MTPRVTSDLLLVGSLPTESTEQTFHRCGPLFADAVPALPDGETGPRTFWVWFEVLTMYREHPDIDRVQEPVLQPGAPWWTPAPMLWLGDRFQFKEGVTETRYERLPRIDEAIASYEVFKSMKEAGDLPADLRFQVCLPFPADAIGNFFTTNFEHDYPIHEKAYEEAFERELPRLLEAIPASELAIQWDVCFEVLDMEGLWPYTSQDNAWQRFAGPASRISRNIPEEVLLGYHFCYGTYPQWPMREADDMQAIVDMANAAVATAGRTVDWLHLAGPRLLRSVDESFYRPLQQLRPGDARVFLGLILPMDGAIGLNIRAQVASKYLDDFGVSMYCGFGRQPGEDAETTLRQHREALDGYRAARA